MWRRASSLWGLRIRLAGFAVLPVLMTVLAISGWHTTALSEHAQAGPRAQATVLGVRVQKHSGRGGPTYTTHYRVRFLAPGGPVTADVTAAGEDPCSCDRTLVAYDAAHPSTVELAGDGRGNRTTAVVFTVLAVLSAVGFWFLVRLMRRRPVSWTIPPQRNRPRRGLVAVALGASVLVSAVTLSQVIGRTAGPSLRLYRRTLTAAAAGQGTGVCLGLPATATDAGPQLPLMTAVRSGLLAAGARTAPARYVPIGDPADDYGPSMNHTIRALGGFVPGPGEPTGSAVGWAGQYPVTGFVQVEARSFRTPAAAAGFADVLVASTCYREARGRGRADLLPTDAGQQVAALPCRCGGDEQLVVTGASGRTAVEVLVVVPRQDPEPGAALAERALAAALHPQPG